MKKTTFRGVMCLIFVLILTAAIVITCGIGSSWFTNGDIRTWFNNWGQHKPIEGGNESNDGENGGNETVEKSENLELTINENDSGISLMRTAIAPSEFENYGVSPQAESAFTITATVKDINGNTPDRMQYVKFEMSEGATESVKMTVVDDLTARFECLKAFGTYIEVKVISTVDTSKYATLKLGYRPDIAGVHIVWNTYSYEDYNVDKNVDKNGSLMKSFLPMSQYGNADNYSHRFGLEISNDMVIWGVGTETLTYDTVEVAFSASGSVTSVVSNEYRETFTVRADSDSKTFISEDRLFVGLGLDYVDAYDYLSVLKGNITQDFEVSFKFSNSETGEEWSTNLMLFVSVPEIGGVGGVLIDKDTIIF